MPPEVIRDDSPLIRNTRLRDPRPVRTPAIYDIINDLYVKAGLIERRTRRRHELRGHSIRKYFRTQLAALGVPSDYIEYMMGHKISTYHDIKMKA